MQQYQTKRPTNPAMEALLFERRSVLDHGVIILLDYMGDEAAIVQAARTSYGKGTKTARTDRGLIRYLMRHRHTSPVEMLELKLYLKLPIFVARQWIRHRTASVNEISARYSILSRDSYLPDLDRLCVQSSTNRQGSGDSLSAMEAERVQELIFQNSQYSFDTYDHLLNDDGNGNKVDEERSQLARELARIGLGLNTYTEWVWKIDLHNLLHFLSLRLHPHAQQEIRVYAEVIASMVEQWLPNVWEAFEEYRLEAHAFSGPEMELIRDLLADNVVHDIDPDARKNLADLFGLGSNRERVNFWTKLGVELP